MEVNEKLEALMLHKQGASYGQIAKKLGISKTRAFDIVKEQKLFESVGMRNEFSSERVPNVRSKYGSSERVTIPIKNKFNEFTGDELITKHFDTLEFEGKFAELIGKPSKLFSAIIWGLPKSGKSNFCLRFADYLQEYFGDVVYIAAEEGESVTLQEKFKQIGGSKITILESRDKNDIRAYLRQKNCQFIFIDSINTAGIDNDFLELIKQENPTKSFISIVQATKSGNFKGDQALTHNCDFIIKVDAGVAQYSGRFNVASEIKIFDKPLYQKNPNKPVKPVKHETAIKNPIKNSKLIDELIMNKTPEIMNETILPSNKILPVALKTSDSGFNRYVTPPFIKINNTSTPQFDNQILISGIIGFMLGAIFNTIRRTEK